MITTLLVALAILMTLYAIFLLVDRVLLADEHPELIVDDERLEEVDRLARRRAMLVKELKDIELDHETSKIDDDDHARLNRRYRAEWLKIDKKLDEVAGLNRAYMDVVDAELERRLSTLGTADERRPRADRAICASCATSNSTDAKHCQQCGYALSAPSTRPIAQPA